MLVSLVSGILMFGCSLVLLAQSGGNQSPTFSALVQLSRMHWIEGCTDAPFSREEWGWLIDTGADSKHVFDCLLRETDLGTAADARDRPGRIGAYEGVLYRPPFFNGRAIPGRQSPTRYPEALIRTRSTVLMVSGNFGFMGGDYGLTQLVHVSDDLFLVGVGYATHDRIYEFFAESGTTQYFSNGKVEVSDAELPSSVVLYGMKSYFVPKGGAFWVDAVVDRDGYIIAILPPDSEWSRCIDTEEFKRRSNLDLSRLEQEAVCYEY